VRLVLGLAAASSAVLALSSCGGGAAATGPDGPPAALVSLRLSTPHFRLFADAVPETLLREVADRLESELPRFQLDLSVGAVRPLTVRVLQDPAAWAAEVEGYFGRRIDTAGYVTSAEELRVLAVAQVARNATHELAHCLSLQLNPSFGNNPRWLWESVALYENREFVDPNTLDYMAAGRPPSLAELDADVTASRKVYDVGYTLGEFVVARGGPAALVSLIRANGDVRAVFGQGTREFEIQWYSFVRERYLP
jgi:hypothetical protein